MNLLNRSLHAAVLSAMLAAPIAALAEGTPAVATPAADAPTATTQLSPTANQAERMGLMQIMRSRMHEILQTQDPAKRKELLEAQMKDMDTMLKMGPPGPGMGMMMGSGGAGMGPGMLMGQGPGMGMMMGPAARKDCRLGWTDHCLQHDALTEQRLDALEKRMDMMQMMMKMMMRE
jgi:hypothetical protein